MYYICRKLLVMEQRQRAVLLVYGEETEGLSIRVPKSKKQDIKSEFYEVLKKYENPTTVMVNCFEKVPGFAVKNQNKQVIKEQKEFYDVLPTEEFYTNDDGEKSWRSFGNLVTSLPKERKMIIDGNLKGLYSAGNKWYTNKIVDNALVILEWNKLDYAKKYLESLIK
jgi:hypothetical protein